MKYGLCVLMLLGSMSIVSAQESVQIAVPAMISFQVVDASASSVGSPDPATISFANASLAVGRALRISVKAEGDMTPPGGPAIPASKISWTTSNASNGVGINGVLSGITFGPVFESQVAAGSGSVDLVWTLTAPGTPLQAGNHSVLLRWKVESITP